MFFSSSFFRIGIAVIPIEAGNKNLKNKTANEGFGCSGSRGNWERVAPHWAHLMCHGRSHGRNSLTELLFPLRFCFEKKF